MATSGNPDRPQGSPETLQRMGTPPPITNEKDSIVKYLFQINKVLNGSGSMISDVQLMQNIKSDIQRSWHPEGYARQSAAVIIGDYCDRRNNLQNIAVPTMVIHGTDDPLVPISNGMEVANLVPNAEFISIDGLGHNIPITIIPRLSQILSNFFSK